MELVREAESRNDILIVSEALIYSQVSGTFQSGGISSGLGKNNEREDALLVVVFAFVGGMFLLL